MSRGSQAASGPIQPSWPQMHVRDGPAGATKKPAAPAALAQVEPMIDAALEAQNGALDLRELRERRGVSGSGSSVPSRGRGAAAPRARGGPPNPSRTSRGSIPRRAYRLFDTGCSVSVTVANTPRAGAPVRARSNSSAPTPRPCASGSTNRS